MTSDSLTPVATLNNSPTELPVNLMASSSSTTVANQSGPNFLQNATGFEIVGGQFVIGDVHNHAVTAPPSGILLSAFNNSDEDFSESEIYCSQLRRQKRGRPLYGPEPQINLSAAFRRRGVAIGDVGRITQEGTFDFFFNIFLPPEHPINGNRTPEDFSPMPPYESVDVSHFNYGPGSYVSTATIQKMDLDPPSDVFPGGDFAFNCDAPRGAVLALPNGAHLEKLDNLENMRAYAAKHADSWYKYVNGARGRGLANGDLCLVTGCEKTRSWGMASYHTGREEFELTFKRTVRPDATYKPYQWSGTHGQKNPARRKSYDPPSTNAPMNQTTFIHGWSISLPTGLWGKLFGTVETASIVDFQSRLNETGSGGSSKDSSQDSRFSLSWFWATGETGGNRRHGAGEHGEVVLSDLSPIAKVFDPAKLINAYILNKVPNATVVMSHDDDWSDILGDDFNITSASDFLQQIDEKFTVAEKDGATFLVPKSSGSSSPVNILTLPTLKSPVETFSPVQNAFQIFRAEFTQLQLNSQSNSPAREEAEMARDAWHQLLPAEKRRYDLLAAQAKEKYARTHPNYQLASRSTWDVLLQSLEALFDTLRRVVRRIYSRLDLIIEFQLWFEYIKHTKHLTLPFTVLWRTFALGAFLCLLLQTSFATNGSSTLYVDNWQQSCAARFNCTSPGLVNINGQPISCNGTIQSAPEVWGITYRACQANCGMHLLRQDINFSAASIPLMTWLLPWLALIAQLPFEASDIWTNILSGFLCIGSPALATYSLALTAFNRWYITDRFKKLRRMAERDTPREYHYIAERVDAAAFILQETAAVIDSSGGPDVGLQFASSIVWSWMFPIVYGYIKVGSQYKAGCIQVALMNNRTIMKPNIWTIQGYQRGLLAHAALYTPLRPAESEASRGPAPSQSGLNRLGAPLSLLHPLASTSGPQRHQPFLASDHDSDEAAKSETTLTPAPIPPDRAPPPPTWCGYDIRGDERQEGPIFNYARVFTWFAVAKHVEHGFEAAITNFRAGQPVPTTTKEAAKCCDWGQHENLTVFQAWSDLPGAAINHMWMAALIALLLQWGTTGAAVFVAYLTPSIGIGCRSGSYLIYGVAATISWLILVLSHLLSHTAMQRLEQNLSPKTGALEALAVGTRLMGKSLAMCNAMWLVASSVMEEIGVFQTCWCQTDAFQYHQSGWAPVFKGQKNFRSIAQGVWIGGLHMFGPVV
ncbi:Pleiotropic drug resistance ABC transporter protein [Mycena venus]|uniref:Pleiotropic drug resistance ABC transporter protein n=1 Tax=Mycena venus TaxID=2733690 RepID=A0A8H7D264_9AGAR|nr:Pleiotropic drug resistance ABC transporter protein [Mycena venus]